uniref:Uncharacterized protein n=1 Tax=Anopheles melas TaxID=34690 RepID=A0A182TNY0_9DIPT
MSVGGVRPGGKDIWLAGTRSPSAKHREPKLIDMIAIVRLAALSKVRSLSLVGLVSLASTPRKTLPTLKTTDLQTFPRHCVFWVINGVLLLLLLLLGMVLVLLLLRI